MRGIQADQYEVVLDLWDKHDKTSSEITDIINRDHRIPQNMRPMTARGISRVIMWARMNKDPRARYHGHRNLSPTPKESVAYRKPKDSLFRRRRPLSEPSALTATGPGASLDPPSQS